MDPRGSVSNGSGTYERRYLINTQNIISKLALEHAAGEELQKRTKNGSCLKRWWEELRRKIDERERDIR